jgi:hypothetical protein
VSTTRDARDLVARMDAARDFPRNTCGASRHVQDIAESLLWGGPCYSLADEPQHCGESLAATAAALWETRTRVEELQGFVRIIANIEDFEGWGIYRDAARALLPRDTPEEAA